MTGSPHACWEKLRTPNHLEEPCSCSALLNLGSSPSFCPLLGNSPLGARTLVPVVFLVSSTFHPNEEPDDIFWGGRGLESQTKSWTQQASLCLGLRQCFQQRDHRGEKSLLLGRPGEDGKRAEWRRRSRCSVTPVNTNASLHSVFIWIHSLTV